jgi:hypothetical protein
MFSPKFLIQKIFKIGQIQDLCKRRVEYARRTLLMICVDGSFPFQCGRIHRPGDMAAHESVPPPHHAVTGCLICDLRGDFPSATTTCCKHIQHHKCKDDDATSNKNK